MPTGKEENKMDLKNDWRNVLCDGIRFGRSFALTTLKTVKYGVEKATARIERLCAEDARKKSAATPCQCPEAKAAEQEACEKDA